MAGWNKAKNVMWFPLEYMDTTIFLPENNQMLLLLFLVSLQDDEISSPFNRFSVRKLCTDLYFSLTLFVIGKRRITIRLSLYTS